MWNTDFSVIFAQWPEAEDLYTNEIETFDQIFATANALCEAYAPPLPEGTFLIPDSWKQAEILQAKHIWSQTGRGNSDTFGPDGLQVSTYSLVMTARDILRPKTHPLGRLR